GGYREPLRAGRAPGSARREDVPGARGFVGRRAGRDQSVEGLVARRDVLPLVVDQARLEAGGASERPFGELGENARVHLQGAVGLVALPQAFRHPVQRLLAPGAGIVLFVNGAETLVGQTITA